MDQHSTPTQEPFERITEDDLVQVMKKYGLQHLYNHLAKTYEKDFVYRPNDDTHFLLRVLESEIRTGRIGAAAAGGIVAEIGTGSGLVIGNFLKWLRARQLEPALAFGIDINIDACQITRLLAQEHALPLQVLNLDAFGGLVPRLQGQFDVIICNPPYVPTDPGELEQFFGVLRRKNETLGDEQANKAINCIDLSYAGGEKGMEVTYRIIEDVKRMLRVGGLFYLFLIEENDPAEIAQRVCANGDFSFEIVETQQAENE